MKWIKPDTFTKRIIKKFCWVPCTIDNVTVWWETVYIKQSYHDDILTKWRNLEFVTKEEYDQYCQDQNSI